MPKVSVVMSVYNGMPFVVASIESIVRQTFTDFEFIIVNDCSTDNSVSAIEQIDDARIRLIHLPHNQGQTAALNVGLKAAQAPYIARQDADDLSKPERLARQVAFLDAHPDHLLVGTAADLIDDNDTITSVMAHPVDDEAVRRALFQDKANIVFHGSVMFRRDVLARAGYYREGFRAAQDYDYWLRIAEAGKVANLPIPTLYQYRLHAGQMTFTSYFRMKEERQIAFDLMRVRQNTQDDEEAYQSASRHLRDKYANFVPTRQEWRRAMAELWRGKGVSHMNAGKRLPMLYCLLRAFLYEPDNPDFWRGVRNHLPF